MTVRILSADDAHDVTMYREIRLAALLADPDAFASTHEREVGFDEARWRERVAGFGGRPGVTFVDELPDLGPMPAGTAGVGYTEWDASPMLVAMWVRPEARGRGVGARLVEAAAAWATAQEADELMLWVVKTNDSAIALYQRCGFEPTGKVDTLPSNPCADELEMRRRLPTVGTG
ncbi:MAG: GNAT family N-acetyltransferase [Actinomycetota bacterium]